MATPRLEVDNSCPTGKAVFLGSIRISCENEGTGGFLNSIITSGVTLPPKLLGNAASRAQLNGGGSVVDLGGGVTLGGGNGSSFNGGTTATLCALAGLPPGCSAADLIQAGAGLLLGGSGSEPPTGDAPIPGLTNGGNGCPEGTIKTPFGCANPAGGTVTGGGMFLTTGEVVHGRFGAGVVPQMQGRTQLRCPRGMVLGMDDVCYDRLTKTQRKWPPGRRPLLTGGDLNAIARASRAATRMKTQQRRLEKLGLLKRPKTGGGSSRGVITKAEAARALRK